MCPSYPTVPHGIDVSMVVCTTSSNLSVLSHMRWTRLSNLCLHVDNRTKSAVMVVYRIHESVARLGNKLSNLMNK